MKVGAKTILNPLEYLKKDKKLNAAIDPKKKSSIEISKGKVWIQDDKGVLEESDKDLAVPAVNNAGGCKATNVVKEVFYNFEYTPVLDGYRITKAQADFILQAELSVDAKYCGDTPKKKSNDNLPGAKTSGTTSGSTSNTNGGGNNGGSAKTTTPDCTCQAKTLDGQSYPNKCFKTDASGNTAWCFVGDACTDASGALSSGEKYKDCANVDDLKAKVGASTMSTITTAGSISTGGTNRRLQFTDSNVFNHHHTNTDSGASTSGDAFTQRFIIKYTPKAPKA
jgi:hypothetical protein